MPDTGEESAMLCICESYEQQQPSALEDISTGTITNCTHVMGLVKFFLTIFKSQVDLGYNT